MSELVDTGTWVQVYRVALAPAERAPGIPDETARLPYECWVKGFLIQPAALGSEATVKTLAGRRVTGTMVAVHLAHTHSFGATHPAMLAVGPELRRILMVGGEER